MSRAYYPDAEETACAARYPASWDPRAAYTEQINELQKRIAVLAKFGEDDFEEGTVITWTKSYSVSYTYVSVKAGGKWWITGRQSGHSLFYSDLVEDHLAHADEDSINIVAKWAVFE